MLKEKDRLKITKLEKEENSLIFSANKKSIENAKKDNINDIDNKTIKDIDKEIKTTTDKNTGNEEKIKKDLEKSKLDEAEQTVSKKSAKKKKITNILVFILNMGVVAGILAYQLVKEPFVSLSGLGLNVGMLLLLIFMFFLAVGFDTISTAYLIRKDTGRWQLGLGFKSTTIGRYYDAITPMAVGGQPFQVAYLKKRDVSSSASLSIPVAKLMFFQLGMFLLSVIALIISSLDKSFGAFASIMSIIGFVLSFSVMFITIFLSLSKNFGKKIVVKVLKLLQRMRIIKNYEKQYLRVTKYVEDYQMIMHDYMKSAKDFIFMFGTSLIRMIVIYSMPFVIYSCFFNDGAIDLYFKFFVCGVLIDLSSGFFPLPGGTGMNELTFGALFGTFFSGGRLFWAIIFWRLVTYYSYILLGIIVLSYDISYGDRKFKWTKKERQLQEESLIFKQIQIQKFRKERATRRKKELKNAE